MELFLKYFTPVICLILIGLIPVYFARIFMFFKRKHFINHTRIMKVSMIAQGIVYGAFLITLIVFTKSLGGYAVYIYGMAIVVFVILLMGYRYKRLHTKRHLYSVFFSVRNNRTDFQQVLDDQKLNNVDITGGAFPYVTSIKFTHMEGPEIKKIFKSFDDKTNLLHPFSSPKALGIMALHVALLNISFVSFILFFILVSSL